MCGPRTDQTLVPRCRGAPKDPSPNTEAINQEPSQKASGVKSISRIIGSSRQSTIPCSPFPSLPRSCLRDQPAYVERPAVQVLFERILDVRQCGRMSGLLARPMPLASMRSAKLVAGSRGCALVARRAFRPVLLRDVVPSVHRPCSAPCTCRLSPVSSSCCGGSQPVTAAAVVAPGAR